MKKKLAACLALVLLALVVTVLAARRMTPAEVPLRVGMTREEVRQVFGDNCPKLGFDCGKTASFVYFPGPGRFGDCHSVVVDYDNGLVTSWEITRPPPTRPPWLDRVMKWVGW
jgi:hypothetical protein